MKKIVSLIALVLTALSLSIHVFAIERVVEVDRYIGQSGWIDSFEDPAYELDKAIPKTLLNSSSSDAYENRIIVTNDPKGQNGKCMAFQYGVFSTESNPLLEPMMTQQFSTASGGAAVFSFDMYLPENFYIAGLDKTSLYIQVYPKYTGTSKTSDYQTWTINENGISIPGFAIHALPIGRWFNVEYILYTDILAGAKADLYIDGEAVEKGSTTVFSLNAGMGLSNIKNTGIASVRFILQTTNNPSVTIEPAYRIYFDNIRIATLGEKEVLGYAFQNNGLLTDTLHSGTTEIKVNIRNKSGADMKPVVMLVVIKNGAVDNVSVNNSVVINQDSEETISASIDLTAIDDDEYQLCAFVWDGMEYMNTLISQFTLKNSSNP